MRALVLTVVHHPDDARIRYRQIAALLDAGWEVTYGAPFSTYHASSGRTHPALHEIDLPPARGRNRIAAWRAARGVLKAHGGRHDVVLLHDPELLTTLIGLRLPPVVWDVHEDTAAAVTLKPWLPRPLRSAAGWAIRSAERAADRRVNLILAEHDYQARFATHHLVVPNATDVPGSVPPPDQPRIVYVGHLTIARGAADLVEVGRRVLIETGGSVRLHLVGHADPAAAALIRPAVEDGMVEWSGFLPSPKALELVDGSMAGLALLHDEPNYRHSMPTKVIEYMARGVPVVTTPLPLARDLVTETGAGLVVPFNDPDAAAKAVLTLFRNAELRHRCAEAGHHAALGRYDWGRHAADFVAELTRVATA